MNFSKTHPEYEKALAFAQKQGALGDVHHIQDKWGGYWQCETKYGPYNFSISKLKD